MRFWKPISLCLVLLLFFTVADAKIIFYSKRDGVSGIYVMNDDGSNVTLLTDTLSPNAPNWSPDGKQIVFSRLKDPKDIEQWHIFLMNADGSNVRQLTAPEDTYRDAHPSFSPDGKSIIFKRLERKENEYIPSIRVINLASGRIKKISDLGVNHPEWSPDGKKIAFSNVSTIGKTGSNIWIMAADGGNPQELLPPEPPPPIGQLIIDRFKPKWSMDGKKILYTEYRHKPVEIDGVVHLLPQGYYYYIYDFTRRQSQRLNIPKDYRSAGINWMDNDKSIVFSAAKTKLNEPIQGPLPPFNTYKYHIATTKITRLTEHPGVDYAFDWISDDVLSVTPKGKKKVTWGTLKK